MSNEQIKVKGNRYVPFEAVSEAWNEYSLGDGNTLMVKLVVMKVLATGEKKPTGEPIYNVEINLNITAYTPEMGYVQAKR